MPVQFRWRNMAEQFEILRRLPDDLKGEAEHLVEARANGAAYAIRAAYHHVSNKLRDGVVVAHAEGGRFGVRYRVISSAPHAWIYDEGTEARHTDLGAGRGAMWSRQGGPPHTFVKTMIAERRALWMDDLSGLLIRHGMVPHGRP